MKKITAIILALFMTVTILSGCGEKEQEVSNKLSIVTTIFPEYDWVKEITKGNDNVEITLLLDNGVDLHSFQPTADDIVKVVACDMFIYVGGESDGWVEDALSEAVNDKMVVVNLLEELGDAVKEEEFVEGMEGEEEEEEDEEEGPEYDEHVWLSVKAAKTLCNVIEEKLVSIDAANADLYKKNTENYTAKLDALDKEYESAVAAAAYKTVLFGDRFPFRYLVDDYNLDYYAAFVGCSAESEASFETISFLASKVDELNLPAILQIETSDGKIAETIKENTKEKNQEILTMDSMQAVTKDDVKEGTSYLQIMETNLSVLKQALK